MNHQFTSQCYRWYVIVGYHLSSVRLNNIIFSLEMALLLFEVFATSTMAYLSIGSNLIYKKNLFFRQKSFLFINISCLQVWYNHYNHSVALVSTFGGVPGQSESRWNLEHINVCFHMTAEIYCAKQELAVTVCAVIMFFCAHFCFKI